ncbi:MAG: PrsW family intramembrane metalloprotease [Candidatus Pacebacteria bacterium]|jgi:RsiW-degrading membrane proteinase PrsW (M82 family)|nr:PrsW family intramembrane metalloprotease [Candidatus Paceibacterota bacterium]
MLSGNPKIIGLAILGGITPSLLWLWFWLKEDKKNPEPRGLLTLVFVMGMLAVILVIPIQRFLQSFTPGETWDFILLAAAEEIIKYAAVVVFLFSNDSTDEPIDWPIYLITAALGFAALENTLYLMKPISLGQTTVGLLTGQLRFLGSTLLHTVSSGIVGIALGFSIHMHRAKQNLYLLFGLIIAITLHSAFNFFIIKNNGSDFLKVFAFLWVVTIMVMLVFEKLRRMV